MEKVELKVGRDVFEIREDDLILDDGSCYQLATRRILRSSGYCKPTVSKVLFSKLKRKGFIYTNKELKRMAIENYQIANFTYWKFDINKMK